ncbi:hypothetical protein K437DRAFT_294774 [Tilletiaria anomala UBC 951]|uniref:SAGA-associated factor 11 n=1 Tax=Tilletiaria anomala (strain ATCC 24038 / CBS 436.72 / UBC 951) TaxID=1037660 RepID=A0A066W0U0_TILAU|nr:uncharacterized protein K437DRAFT_294774 [Tilletiaria anomala UBC 951]KDN44689.1 hypothetical protein K437DRAFT_294774 [Tilletiaria anomala UBC 951]
MSWKVQAKRDGLERSKEADFCHICGQNCAPHSGSILGNASGRGSASLPGSASGTPVPVDLGTATGTPSRVGTPGPTSNSAGNPLKPDIYAQNPLFECIVCSRQVSSNRYAVHLAKCLGIGGKEKSVRKAGSGLASSTASDAGGVQNSLLNNPRVIGVLEQRKRTKAPDAKLRAARGENMEKGKGKNKVLNANGKRALSPGVAMGAHWKKMKTHTPPPGSTTPREDTGMVRSQSVQVVSMSHSSTAPMFASPLNPNKRANITADDTTGVSEREVSPSISVSTTAGDMYDASSSAAWNHSGKTGTAKERGNAVGTAARNRVSVASGAAGGPKNFVHKPGNAVASGSRAASAMSDDSPLKNKKSKAMGDAESDSESYHETDSDVLSGGDVEEESEMSEESSLDD